MRRMQLMMVLSAVIGAGACAGGPSSYVVAAPQPQDAAFACALAKVNELGYTVENSNKESGLIVATKDRTTGAARFLTNRQNHDHLTISIFDATGNGGRKIRATIGSITKTATLLSSSSREDGPSKEGVDAANQILLACGQGAVSMQTSSTLTSFTGLAAH